jgi:nitroreductase
MKFKDLVLKNRSYRRFDNSYKLESSFLTSLIDLTRFTPSAANLQPLKYHISTETDLNQQIFECLAWAGYISDWDGPAVEEQPTGYITILLDESIKKDADCDHGIAAQTILLGAAEKDISGCIIASIKKEKLMKVLNLADHLKVLLVLALGKGKEEIILEDVKPGSDIRYWRDKQEVHHVPKRMLEDIIIR